MSAALEKLRDEVFDVDARMARGQLAIPQSKRPHGGGFFALPQQQLLSYYTSRDASPIGQLLAFTKRLMSQVDRVVVVGPTTMLVGPCAIMNACCQPYYNELSRAERGSRPRVTFAGDDLDNDRLQGLMHLLNAHRGKVACDVADAWGLVVLSPNETAPEVSFAIKLLREALWASCGGDAEIFSQRLFSVEMEGATTSQPGAGCCLHVPPCVSEAYSVLSPVGLAPAAILGVNIMKLQEGALAINDNFIHARAKDNQVLQAAAAQHLLAQAGCRRVIAPWDLALEDAGRWMAMLSAGCGRSPAVASGVRDLGEWIQSLCQQTSGSQWVELLTTKCCRFDVLPGGASQVAAPSRQAQELYATLLTEARCPSCRWTLPSSNEYSLGQFLQTQMLVAVVRAKLSGANPYAQKALDDFRGKLLRVVGS